MIPHHAAASEKASLALHRTQDAFVLGGDAAGHVPAFPLPVGEIRQAQGGVQEAADGQVPVVRPGHREASQGGCGAAFLGAGLTLQRPQDGELGRVRGVLADRQVADLGPVWAGVQRGRGLFLVVRVVFEQRLQQAGGVVVAGRLGEVEVREARARGLPGFGGGQGHSGRVHAEAGETARFLHQVAQEGRGEGGEPLYLTAQRLKTLPDHLQLYPGAFSGSVCGRKLSGHPSSTMGFERRHNSALAISDEVTFVAMMLQDVPPRPEHFELTRALNSGYATVPAP